VRERGEQRLVEPNGYGDGTQTGIAIVARNGTSVTGTDRGLSSLENNGTITGRRGIFSEGFGALIIRDSATIAGDDNLALSVGISRVEFSPSTRRDRHRTDHERGRRHEQLGQRFSTGSVPRRPRRRLRALRGAFCPRLLRRHGHAVAPLMQQRVSKAMQLLRYSDRSPAALPTTRPT
jgi:hypothetical protein